MPGRKPAKKPAQKKNSQGTQNRESPPVTPRVTRGKRTRIDDGEHQGTEKRQRTTESQTVTTDDIPKIVTTVLASLSATGAPDANTSSGASGNTNPTPTRDVNDDSSRPLTADDIYTIVETIVSKRTRETTARDPARSSFSDLGKQFFFFFFFTISS